MLISDEKETGIFINERNHYEKIEDGNYNAIRDVKFDLKEKYSAYLLLDGKMKLIKFQALDKYVLCFDKTISDYNMILEKDKNLYNVEDVNINDFAFYKTDNLVFLDRNRKKTVDMDIMNNSFNEIVITNRTIFDLVFQKILITPNNKKLILLTDNYTALIKDLETGREELIPNVMDAKISKSGVYLVYKYARKFSFHDLYTYKHVEYEMDVPFEDYMLSYSERYIVYINTRNPNQLNYLDRKENRTNRDAFIFNRVKYIKNIRGLYDDNILVYGKLFDMDYNDKLDYRDLNSMIYFNLSDKNYSMILDNIDDFHGLSNYKKYIIFSRYKKLFMTEMKYKKISH